MKKQQILKIKQLSVSVGHFIRYWGFRKIHGEIWTLVYLSQEPLSGVEITNFLGVSKALVSPALKELEQEGLIRPAQSENSKTKRYEAEEDIVDVIQGVLRRREKRMVEQIRKNYEDFVVASTGSEHFNSSRLEKVGELIQIAELGLGTLVEGPTFSHLEV